MAFIYNIAFNCGDPSALADFWAGATGYIHDPETADTPDRRRLRAPDGQGVRHLLFLRADAPEPHSTAVHLDLASRDPEAEVARLLKLGATLADGETLAWRGSDDKRWVVLRDPEGNEFCLG